MAYWIRFSFLVLMGLALLSGCKPRKYAVNYEAYETECLGVGSEGTQLFKIWSYGRSVSAAVDLAKKNAVHAVIFRGIPAGTSGCMKRAFISGHEAEDKHKDFFQDFFRPQGPYLRYVSLSGDGTILPKDRIRVGKDYKVGVSVSVAHHALRQELERKGVIRALNDGF